MGVYIKNWSLADWKELLKWAKIGLNNAMIGEFSEVEEVPPHGRLIDADAIFEEVYKVWGTEYDASECNTLMGFINEAPTIIPAEPCKEKGE